MGLAMDAFSASVANGLRNTSGRLGYTLKISGTFSFFQMIMPLIGWILVKVALDVFCGLERIIPFVSLLLLTFIGAKMIYENSISSHNSESLDCDTISNGKLAIQGVATSLDALSVGFTISSYDIRSALASAVVIGAVTFLICGLGVIIGSCAMKYSSAKVEIAGGIILIAVGIEIFVSSLV